MSPQKLQVILKTYTAETMRVLLQLSVSVKLNGQQNQLVPIVDDGKVPSLLVEIG